MAFDGCSRFRDRAAPFVLGDLPGDERAQMVAHVDSCPTCRREVDGLNGVLDSLSAVAAPLDPHPGFVDRVLAAAERDPALVPFARPVPAAVAGAAVAPGPRSVAVVMRRRRTLLGLTGLTAALGVVAIGTGSWVPAGLAIFSMVLEVTYLGLVMAVTHVKAREELTTALAGDDRWWDELPPVRTFPVDAPRSTPIVSLGDLALAHFVVSYFTGWLLMPVVACIALVRGDLTGIEQSPVLARIVALQRQGRSQSLRLLVAGATTVAVAGGGTAAMVLAPGVASAATPPAAQAHYNPADPPSAPSGVAAEHTLAVTHLAQLNAVAEAAAATPDTPRPDTPPS